MRLGLGRRTVWIRTFDCNLVTMTLDNLIGTTILPLIPKKPIRSWLAELPNPVRDIAIRNFDAWYERNPELKVMRGSLPEALMCAFPWHRTKQGAEYWLGLYEELTGTVTTCISVPSTKPLIVKENKFGGFFEY